MLRGEGVCVWVGEGHARGAGRPSAPPATAPPPPHPTHHTHTPVPSSTAELGSACRHRVRGQAAAAKLGHEPTLGASSNCPTRRAHAHAYHTHAHAACTPRACTQPRDRAARRRAHACRSARPTAHKHTRTRASTHPLTLSARRHRATTHPPTWMDTQDDALLSTRDCSASPAPPRSMVASEEAEAGLLAAALVSKVNTWTFARLIWPCAAHRRGGGGVGEGACVCVRWWWWCVCVWWWVGGWGGGTRSTSHLQPCSPIRLPILLPIQSNTPFRSTCRLFHGLHGQCSAAKRTMLWQNPPLLRCQCRR